MQSPGSAPIDFSIFKAGLSGLLKELSRLTGREKETAQLVLGGEAQARIGAFKELVRARETIFHFGEVATVLTPDPKAKLEELFKYFSDSWASAKVPKAA